jgi:hypothetical protein
MTTIIPIMTPMFVHSTGMPTYKDLLSIMIGINLPFILWYIINSIRWFRQSEESYFKFVFYDGNMEVKDVIAICFITFNIISLMIFSIIFVRDLLS